MDVDVDFVKDKLKGDDFYEIKVTFLKKIEIKILDYED